MYVGASKFGILVFDISNKKEPKELGQIAPNPYVNDSDG